MDKDLNKILNEQIEDATLVDNISKLSEQDVLECLKNGFDIDLSTLENKKKSCWDNISKQITTPEPDKKTLSKLVTSLFEVFSAEKSRSIFALSLPIAHAAAPFAQNETYSIISVTVPLQNDQGTQKYIVLGFHINILWTKKEIWGRIDLKISDEKKPFPNDQIRAIFSKFKINIHDQEKILYENLKLSRDGNFSISKNSNEIENFKKLLSSKSLKFELIMS